MPDALDLGGDLLLLLSNTKKLVPLDDLGGALVDLHSRGLRIVGADEKAALSYRDADLRGPLALAVGSEGHGISGGIRRRLDLAVRIPMHGQVASLNVAVAGSVLLFEAASQRPHGEPANVPDGQPKRSGTPEVSDTDAAQPDLSTTELGKASPKPKRTRAAAKPSPEPAAQASELASPAAKPRRARAAAKPKSEPAAKAPEASAKLPSEATAAKPKTGSRDKPTGKPVRPDVPPEESARDS
jgi:hypothetical protein